MGMESAPQVPVETKEEKTPPTVEDLQKQMEELKAKVALAQAEKAKDIDQKIVDRESLIAEMQKNDGLLSQATETLEYFVSAQASGVVDSSKTEELQTLVSSLEQRRDEMSKKIDTISSNPEVLGKIQDEAIKENEYRDKIIETEKQQEQSKVEKENQITEAVQEFQKQIELLKEKTEELESLKKIKDEAIQSKETIIKEFKARVGEKSKLYHLLNRMSDNSTEEVGKELIKIRGELGIFAIKEKGAIDTVLSNINVFDNEKISKDRAYKEYHDTHSLWVDLTNKLEKPVFKDIHDFRTMEDYTPLKKYAEKSNLNFEKQVGELRPNFNY